MMELEVMFGGEVRVEEVLAGWVEVFFGGVGWFDGWFDGWFNGAFEGIFDGKFDDKFEVMLAGVLDRDE